MMEPIDATIMFCDRCRADVLCASFYAVKNDSLVCICKPCLVDCVMCLDAENDVEFEEPKRVVSRSSSEHK